MKMRVRADLQTEHPLEKIMAQKPNKTTEALQLLDSNSHFDPNKIISSIRKEENQEKIKIDKHKYLGCKPRKRRKQSQTILQLV